jgi:hypothetical protein
MVWWNRGHYKWSSLPATCPITILYIGGERQLTGGDYRTAIDRSWPIRDRFSRRKAAVRPRNPRPSAFGKSRPSAARRHSPLSGTIMSLLRRSLSSKSKWRKRLRRGKCHMQCIGAANVTCMPTEREERRQGAAQPIPGPPPRSHRTSNVVTHTPTRVRAKR